MKQEQLNNFIEYANHVQADEHVKAWVSNVLGKQELTTEEGEHIIDFLVSDVAPKRISKMSFDDAKRATDKWNKALQKKGAEIEERPEDVITVLDFNDGFRIVRLIGENAYKREGFLMRHCCGSYYGRDVEIYSLRDQDNLPHATFEKDKQVKGKGNGDIIHKYIDYCVKFLEYIGMIVGDSEMTHLGYINTEKFKHYLHKDTKFFRDKYVNRNTQLIDVDGEPYLSLDILDVVPLITENKDKKLCTNIDISLLCKASSKWLLKDKKDSSRQAQGGDYSRQAQGGDSSRQAQSGDYSRQAQGGFASRQAQSGDSSQQVQSGVYSRQAQGGDSSRQAQSGDYSRQAQSGDYSRQAQSGDSSRQVQSGDYSRQAQSGFASRQAQSGDSSQQAQSGDSSRQAQSGGYSQQVQSGDYSRQAQSGFASRQEMLGQHSVAVSAGAKGYVRGKKGCWFALTEWSDIDNNLVPLCVKAFKIDGKKVKEDTWYTLKNGKLVAQNPK